MKKYKAKAKMGLVLLISVLLITLLSVKDAKAWIQDNSNNDQPWSTLYHDETYEYDYGTNIVMANWENGKGYTPNNLNDNNPTSYIDTSNRRDRTTAIRNSDRRGWDFLYATWMDSFYFNAYHQMYTANQGYNEY
ncbi:MAG: hypothetical protein J0I68_00225, partial [Achromobacter sp.]|uniref:hypothetical protein n=1 Tax=Achromobacter sp. TaxID=134375 RepID=UPI001AD3E330